MTSVTFHWDGDHLAAALPHGARALFSSRRGGVSEGPFASLNLGRAAAGQEVDDPARVAENRARLEQAAAPLRLARQVHGADVATDDDAREEADGQATRRRGVGAAVLVADCLPVVLAGPGGVAALHAGWRGLAGGVLERGVAALGGPDQRLAAAIGPGIGVCCFEVGDEVRDAFGDHAGARRGRHLDLAAIARRILLDAGVDEVAACGLCTHCEPELFFSHRRDGGRTGRQAGVAWLS